MRPTLTRSTQAVACAAALLVLTACGGDADGERVSTTSSVASSSSSKPAYDDEYAYSEAKKSNEALLSHDSNKPLPEDVEWATANYIKTYNEALDAIQEAGAKQRGNVSVQATHLAESKPAAPGGWDLSMYQCSTSTVRLYKGGKDVTAHPLDPSKPLPKGSRKNVHLLNFTTPDDGKTWQLDKAQILSGKDAKNSPCEVS
ncbi:hypothetical protein SAMN06296429_104294 [Janibacter indicus]|uniref:Lipoprotein n=1 Tax=Janibacter indicus TaxID=857417 RepID=A0A1W1ZX80_9MICO|nr:hypothetical protein SAMN06296429_104294 [Janibacter indicus]